MIPKEREIDKLVQQIFNAISEKSYLQNTLFILVGDHGMDSRGNHGGSLESEMSAALVFMSPVFQRLYPGQESPTRPIEGNFGYHKLIDQTDIVPTISGLIGVTVPKLNLGVVIPDLLPLWKNTHEHVNLLHQNAAQIMALYLDWLSLSPAADYEIFNLWKRVEIELDSSPGNALSVLYEVCRVTLYYCLSTDWSQFCRRAQHTMSIPHGDISYPPIFYGLIAGLVAIVTALLVFRTIPPSLRPEKLKIATFTLLYGLTMFDIRLIEKEHLFWYYGSLIYTGYVSYAR